MTGTEKQIKLAEDILAKASNHISIMVDYCKSNKAYASQLPAWEYMSERYAIMFRAEQFQSAKFVIDHRDNIIFRTDDVMSRIETVSRNTGVTMVEAAKKVIG